MLKKLEFLIVEDDLNFAIDLQMMLEEMDYNVLDQVDNAAKALEVIFSKKPDIILMDIDIIGDMTGIDIGKSIKHLNIPIIFITSFNDTNNYNEAQESNIKGYLIKPPNKFTLQTAINNIIEAEVERTENPIQPMENPKEDEHIFLKKKSTYHKINYKEVECIEADGNYSQLYVGDDRFISKYNLSEIEQELPKPFIRTHRSFIINLDYVVAYDPTKSVATIKQGKEIPISRKYKEDFTKKIKLG